MKIYNDNVTNSNPLLKNRIEMQVAAIAATTTRTRLVLPRVSADDKQKKRSHQPRCGTNEPPPARTKTIFTTTNI